MSDDDGHSGRGERDGEAAHKRSKTVNKAVDRAEGNNGMLTLFFYMASRTA